MSGKRSRAAAAEASATAAVTNSHQQVSLLLMLLPPGLLAIITALVYYPSLTSPFQFDDIANITKNFHIRSFDVWKYMFRTSRWVGDFVNAINFKIGHFDPYYYRVVNIGIHLLTGITLFYFILYLCDKTTRTPFVKENGLWLATLTSGLFLLHPVQSQTVSYIIQGRLEGLASFFIIAGLFAYTATLRAQSYVFKGLFFGLFSLFSVLALGTKEIVVVMPCLAVLIDWFFIAEQSWDSFKFRVLIYAALSATVVSFLLLYLDTAFLKQVLTLQYSTPNNRGNILTPDAYDQIKALPFLTSQFKVILHYLIMFFVPLGLCVEYDWILADGFFAPDAFFPFLVLAAIFGSVAYFMKQKKLSHINFGLLWFIISVAPRSSIIPSPELIVDYKTYLASIGPLFIFASLLVSAFNYIRTHATNLSPFIRSGQGFIAATSLLCMGMSYATVQRNKVWESSENFWRDIVEKAPLKARAHNNLGVALAEQGHHKDAIPLYIQAIKLDQCYCDPLNNLAVAYSHEEKYDKALAAFAQSIRLFPHYPEAHNNSGSILIKLGRYEEAEKYLRAAISVRPHYGKAYYNLGHLHLKKENYEESWKYFKKATEMDLDEVAHAYQTLGQLSLKLKKYPEAVDAFEKMTVVIKRSTNLAGKEKLLTDTYFNLANAYFVNNQPEKSESLYLQLSNLNPTESKYAHNYAETLYIKKDYEASLRAFDRARRLPQSLPQSHMRFVNCLENLNRFDDAINYLQSLASIDSAPDEFKKAVRQELTRVSLQAKVNQDGGIKLGDIGQAQQILDGEKTEIV